MRFKPRTLAFGCLGVMGVCLWCGIVAAAAGYYNRQQVLKAVEGDDHITLQIDDRDRSFYVHVPPDAPEGPLPLIIALHGGGGDAASMASVSGFSDLADDKGFIVAYPDGTGGSIFEDRFLTWNGGACCGYAYEQGVDDVAFFSAMIDYIMQNYNADPDAVLVTGISNGGMMSYRVACELSDQITAIAPVAGSFHAPTCDLARPVSLLIIHGTDDQYVRYEGGETNGRLVNTDRVDPSVAEAANFWRTVIDCPQTPSVDERVGDVETVRYGPCNGDAVVQVVTLHGGEHSWPGGDRGFFLLDPVFEDYDASAEIWAFLQKVVDRQP